MSYAQQMLTASPSRVPGVSVEILAAAVTALFDTAQACTTCADACLGEREPQRLDALARCIRLNLHCSDMCVTTGRLLSRQEQPALARAVVEACALSCHLCSEECERHAAHTHMTHCRLCAEACRRCEAACQAVLAALPA
ncbi:MAG: four-helix bundle copper-binding protein [Chloroflexi bacterium]|nr:four-helix bundle copper-binding protein [Chloroflexota bacterium]